MIFKYFKLFMAFTYRRTQGLSKIFLIAVDIDNFVPVVLSLELRQRHLLRHVNVYRRRVVVVLRLARSDTELLGGDLGKAIRELLDIAVHEVLLVELLELQLLLPQREVLRLQELLHGPAVQQRLRVEARVHPVRGGRHRLLRDALVSRQLLRVLRNVQNNLLRSGKVRGFAPRWGVHPGRRIPGRQRRVVAAPELQVCCLALRQLKADVLVCAHF